MNSYLLIFTALLFTVATSQVVPPQSIGVNMGTNGNNLPAAADVKNLYAKCQIQQMRLFEPNPDILGALRQSGIKVSLGVRNEDLPSLGDPAACTTWLNNNVVPYKDDIFFTYITMGNEVIPGQFAQNVPTAITSMQNALNSLGIAIKVTTVVPTTVLGASFPPSNGTFSDDVSQIMGNIVSILSGSGTPLMVNVYPYFSYASNPTDISLEYATFQSTSAVVVDGDFQYFNLFDAIVDAFHAAIDKLNVGSIPLAISESGWPTAGNDPYASVDNAKVYNANLVDHVSKNGTPRRPQDIMDTFIFAMFNENLKPEGVEQNFGLFYPSMDPVYPVFSC